MRLLEESLGLHYSLLTTSGLGPSAIWWPVTLLVYPPSVRLPHCGLTQLALHPQQIGWAFSPAFPVAPRSSVGIYSQTIFFWDNTHGNPGTCLSKAVHVATAKALRSTRIVTELRWLKVQPTISQQMKWALGDTVGNC